MQRPQCNAYDLSGAQLVSSFMGEGDMRSHTSHKTPLIAEQNMGSLWTDIRDSVSTAVTAGGQAAAGQLVTEIAQQEQVQQAAKESAFLYILENYWKEILVGTVVLVAGGTYLITRQRKKR